MQCTKSELLHFENLPRLLLLPATAIGPGSLPCRTYFSPQMKPAAAVHRSWLPATSSPVRRVAARFAANPGALADEHVDAAAFDVPALKHKVICRTRVPSSHGIPYTCVARGLASLFAGCAIGCSMAAVRCTALTLGMVCSSAPPPCFIEHLTCSLQVNNFDASPVRCNALNCSPRPHQP